MKRIIWLALFLVCMGHFAEAQGWRRTYTFSGNPFTSYATVAAQNDSFVTVGVASPRYLAIQKCGPNGIPVWQKSFTNVLIGVDTMSMCRANDGGYIVAVTNLSATPHQMRFIKIDEQGNLVWQKSYNSFPNSSYISRVRIIPNKAKSGYSSFNSYDATRITNNGDSLITERTDTLGSSSQSWILNSKVGKDFFSVVKKFVNGMNRTFIIEANDGNNYGFSSTLFDELTGSNTLRLSDGNYLIYGYTSLNGTNFVKYVKITPNGQIVWTNQSLSTLTSSRNSSDPNAFATSDGGFVESFFQNGTCHLIKINADGNIVWDRTLPIPYSRNLHSIIQSSDGGFVIGSLEMHVKVDANGDLYSSQIIGRVREDVSNDCIAQVNEPRFRGLITISATKNGTTDTYYSAVDSLGNYKISVDTGNHIINVNNFWSQYWQNCTPSVSRNIPVLYTTDSADFALKPLINCPAMRVNAGTWGLRRCFENTYSVNYFNDGTTVARNAYVEITIDSLMEFRRASRPLSSRVGQRLRFNVGDVDYGRGGNFDVTVYVKCGDSTRLNQTLCFETHVFPDTICTPTTGWNGANIVVTGTCARDSVEFTIRNTGNAATGTVRSLIVEDQVMFAVQPISLPPNGVLIKKQPANGSTWRLSVQQVANNPRSTFATAFVEGCRNNPTAPFSTGNATAFPDADGDAAVDIQCLAIRGAYDPNDKTGYPLGTGTSRQIGQNQDIEYLIRFQNTGTDTAFQVVLRDTLPSQLDLTSIEPGASSHPYTWDLTGKGVLIFNFDNIQLMDSFRNEPASHGFVKFRIKQKKDLPIGTKIENSAGIYFDFNAPVITNRTLHTIGKDFLLTATVERVFDEKVKIEVFPNPFSDFLTFNIKQATPSVNEGIFELFDLTGKVLRREKFVDNQFTFERKDLPMGLFIFKISTVDGRLIGQGKVVAK